jgi:hypothetical protein
VNDRDPSIVDEIERYVRTGEGDETVRRELPLLGRLERFGRVPPQDREQLVRERERVVPFEPLFGERGVERFAEESRHRSRDVRLLCEGLDGRHERVR